MKVIIAGSRTITDKYTVIEGLLKAGYTAQHISEIVSGTARGVDSLGEEIGRDYRIPIKQFPADWDTYGKSAGYRRNAEMAKYADSLVAIWDGVSRGTRHMINLMEKQNKPVYIHKV